MNELTESSGFCVHCSEQTNLVCHRCGDFYCSKKCQLDDWQRHRYICFAIPALVHPLACSALGTVNLPFSTNEGSERVMQAIEETEVKLDKANNQPQPNKLELKLTVPSVSPVQQTDKSSSNNTCSASSAKILDINETKPTSNNNNITTSSNSKALKKIMPKSYSLLYANKPTNNSEVCLQGFRFPNCCFIREASEAAEKAYSIISEQLLEKGGDLPKVTNLKCQYYALAQFGGKLHRVKVLAIQSNTLARLAFVDLGIIKVLKIDEMRVISSELLGLTCYTLQTHLKGVPNYTMGEEVHKFLAQFSGERFKITYDSKGGVELLHIKTQLSLNEQIRKFCSTRQGLGKKSPVSDLQKIEKPIQSNSKPSLNKETVTTQKDNTLESQSSSEASSIELLPSNQADTSLDVLEPKLNKGQTAVHALELHLKKKSTVYSEGASCRPPELTDEANLKVKAKDVQLDKNFNIDLKMYPLVGIEDDPLNQETLKTNQTKTGQIQENDKDKLTKNDSGLTKDVQVNDANPSPLVSSSGEPQKITLNGKVEGISSPCLCPPFEMRRLVRNKREGLDVFIVDNTNISRGIIGAFDSENARDFSDLHFRLSGFNDSQPHTPVAREYVIAKFEGTWYRAKVLEIKQNETECLYNVVYLEFTNVATVKKQDIRRYPSDLTIPCHTNVCLIEGFPHRPTTAQIKYLEEELQMHSLLHIDFVSYLHDMALIRCNSLIQELSKLSK